MKVLLKTVLAVLIAVVAVTVAQADVLTLNEQIKSEGDGLSNPYKFKPKSAVRTKAEHNGNLYFRLENVNIWGEGEQQYSGDMIIFKDGDAIISNVAKSIRTTMWTEALWFPVGATKFPGTLVIHNMLTHQDSYRYSWGFVCSLVYSSKDYAQLKCLRMK